MAKKEFRENKQTLRYSPAHFYYRSKWSRILHFSIMSAKPILLCFLTQTFWCGIFRWTLRTESCLTFTWFGKLCRFELYTKARQPTEHQCRWFSTVWCVWSVSCRSPLAALRQWAGPLGYRCQWNRPCRSSSCSGCFPGGGLLTAGRKSWQGTQTLIFITKDNQETSQACTVWHIEKES